MSRISFYDACKIACIKAQTSLPKLFEEMQKQQGQDCSYNYVYQVLKGQRINETIVSWYSNRLAIYLKEIEFTPLP